MSGPAPDDPRDPVVVALGGNALLRRGERGTIEEQQAHARAELGPVADLIAAGRRVVLTHGNGPVVGNIVERGEAARAHIAPMPLWIADADSQGGIGSMLALVLDGLLADRACGTPIVTVVTHVVVDPDDPAFAAPTKPIGPWYDAVRARELESAEGWAFREVAGSGWRRVVASPQPLEVVEAEAILALCRAGRSVIAGGGGGIPVIRGEKRAFFGIDAVVDKDATSALLARDLGAHMLVILTEADAVYERFGMPDAHRLERLTAAEAETLARELDAGSIAPKLSAAAAFARSGGRAVICSGEDLAEALQGAAGTQVVP